MGPTEPVSAIQPPPGWWQASDGRWYAAELHPDARVTSGPGQPAATIFHRRAHTRPVRPRRWVWAVTGVAALLVVAAVVTAVAGTSHGKGAAPAAAAASSRRAASGAPAASGSASPTAHGGGQTSTSAPATPAGAPATTPGSAGVGTASEVATGPPSGDVSVSRCAVDPIDPQRAVVDGTVVNHDTHTDDYTIIVGFQQGGRVVGSAFVTDNQVAVGSASPWSAVGTLSTPTGSGLTCSVSFVQRASS